MSAKNPACGRQGGFSLVELMVSMLLGLILIAGAVSVYIASSRTYSQVEQVAVLSENGRFGLQLVSDALRHTGFFGAVPANRVSLDGELSAVAGDCSGNAAAYDLDHFLFAVAVSGDGDTGGTALGCIDDAVGGTDVLVIKHAVPVERSYSDCDIDLSLVEGDSTSAPEGASYGSYLLTNSIRGLIFNCHGTPPTAGVGGDIPNGSLWQYQMQIYYIRDGDVPTLSRKYLAWNGSAMELRGEDMAPGVERMHISFGYDSSGDGEVDSYGNAGDVTADVAWNKVQALNVHLLLRSVAEDASYNDSKTYSIPGVESFTPADSYRRLLLNTRVLLRNPKLVVRGGA